MDLGDKIGKLKIRKSPYAEALSRTFIPEEEEEKYLQSIANKYVKGKPRSYLLVRSIVMDVHVSLEFYMNSVINFFCVFGGKQIGMSITYADMKDSIGDIPYFKKISIVKKLGVFTGHSVEVLKRVNNLRVAFAHGHDKGNPTYNYYGNSIFQRKIINKLIADQKSVLHEFSNFLKKLGLLK